MQEQTQTGLLFLPTLRKIFLSVKPITLSVEKLVERKKLMEILCSFVECVEEMLKGHNDESCLLFFL